MSSGADLTGFERARRNGVWLILGAILIVWLFALCSWSGLLQSIFPRAGFVSVSSGEQVLGIFGVGLTIAVGVLWIANETGVIKLAATTGRAIWVTLIVSILGASASFYRGYITGKRAQRLKVDTLTLLDVDASGNTARLADPLTPKSTAVYEHPTDPVAFVAVLSGFAIDDVGNPQLQYRFYLEHPGDLRAHYAEGSRNLAKSPYATDAQMARLKSLFGDMSKRVSIAYVLAEREDIGRGSFILRAIVKDELSNETTEATLPLVIR